MVGTGPASGDVLDASDPGRATSTWCPPGEPEEVDRVTRLASRLSSATEIHGRGRLRHEGSAWCPPGPRWPPIRASGIRLVRAVVRGPLRRQRGGRRLWRVRHAPERGHTGDACIITDLTDQWHLGDRQRRRALTFRIEVPGQATHGSTRLSLVVSAVDAYVRIHECARSACETRRNNRSQDPLMADWPIPYPLSVGTLRAGDWASSVPYSPVAEGRLGVRLG